MNVAGAWLTWFGAFVLLLSIPPAHADGLQEGQWEVTNQPAVNGAPAPPTIKSRCMSAAEVGDLDKTFSPVARTTNSECERVEHEFSPQRLKWRLLCKGQLDMDVAGEYVFDTPQHYTGTINTQASMLGRVIQTSKVTIEATRTGDCQ